MAKSMAVKVKPQKEGLTEEESFGSHLSIGNEQEGGGSEEEDEDDEGEEEEEEEEDEEEENEEEEEEEKELEIKIKKKRCVRRLKIKQICRSSEDEEEEEGEGNESEGHEEDEEEEDKEEEEEEKDRTEDLSFTSSILSAISFQWENEIYEFEALCDPDSIYPYHSDPDFFNEPAKARYMNMCKGLSITPMLWFFKALDMEEINLSFRQLNGKNIRSMCAALEINVTVERLIFSSCKLTPGDCFHIGLTLSYNEVIKLLDLTRCRIGPEGVEQLSEHLLKNEALEELNLSKCYIEDEGLKFLTPVLMRSNSTITKLDLSYNRLNGEAGEILATVLKLTKTLTHLNLRYNFLFDLEVMKEFFRGMALNTSITHLNLAWNGLTGEDMGGYIGTFLLKNQTILFLDLSNNRLQGAAILKIRKGLARSKSLETLKMGKNPASPEDLEFLLNGAKVCPTLNVLDLEELWVNKSFIKILKKIQLDKEIEVNLGGIYGNYEIKGPDYPKVILQRAEYEAKKPKKKKMKKDFGHLMWSLGEEPLTGEDFLKRVKKFRAKVSKDLIAELMAQFQVPDKGQMIDVKAMREKYLTIFPDSPPPPPSKVKGKKKKKDKKEKAIKSEEEKETKAKDKKAVGKGIESKLLTYDVGNFKKTKTPSLVIQKQEEGKEEGEGEEDEYEEEEGEDEENEEDEDEEEEGEEEEEEGQFLTEMPETFSSPKD